MERPSCAAAISRTKASLANPEGAARQLDSSRSGAKAAGWHKPAGMFAVYAELERVPLLADHIVNLPTWGESCGRLLVPALRR